MNWHRIAALDIGGTNIKACLFCEGILSGTMEIPTEAYRGAQCVLKRAAAVLEKLAPFDGIGISTTGQVDSERGIIAYANENMPGYTGTDIKGFFTQRFRVPVAVVNDVYAAALGEGTYGAGKGEKDYICLTYGTGIGGGVVLNGIPYYGKGASAGVMLGGMIFRPEKISSEDPFSGSYERFASAAALVRMGKRVDPTLADGREIFMRLEEPEIRTVVEKWMDEVAAGICSLIHIYNVPLVILGGGVMEQSYVLEGVQRRTQQWIIPGFRTPCIKKAELGNMAGLYGSVECLRQHLG